MTDLLEQLTALAREFQTRLSLEESLQRIADRSAVLLEVDRVSVRLLDHDRSELVAVARSGAPMHAAPARFKQGEGLMGWIVDNAAPIRTDDADGDPRFQARPGLIEALGAFVGVPMLAGQDCIGVISSVGGDRPFTAHDQAVLELISAMCAPHVEIARLSRLSTVDPLTGTLNRRGLDRSFPEVAVDGTGAAQPLAVAMVDIDHFKQVNDSHGHAVGDLVLKHVADVLARTLRSGDAVVRVGGEEFLLVLPGVDLATAAGVAERTRAAVEGQPAVVTEDSVPVTISIGVAQREDGENRDHLIARADEALYRAKRGGRNRIVVGRRERRS
jgi:diguanylate cyclase (GGDEF)-like protein